MVVVLLLAEGEDKVGVSHSVASQQTSKQRGNEKKFRIIEE